jgi:hypothetical protein
MLINCQGHFIFVEKSILMRNEVFDIMLSNPNFCDSHSSTVKVPFGAQTFVPFLLWLRLKKFNKQMYECMAVAHMYNETDLLAHRPQVLTLPRSIYAQFPFFSSWNEFVWSFDDENDEMLREFWIFCRENIQDVPKHSRLIFMFTKYMIQNNQMDDVMLEELANSVDWTDELFKLMSET